MTPVVKDLYGLMVSVRDVMVFSYCAGEAVTVKETVAVPLLTQRMLTEVVRAVVESEIVPVETLVSVVGEMVHVTEIVSAPTRKPPSSKPSETVWSTYVDVASVDPMTLRLEKVPVAVGSGVASFELLSVTEKLHELGPHGMSIENVRELTDVVIVFDAGVKVAVPHDGVMVVVPVLRVDEDVRTTVYAVAQLIEGVHVSDSVGLARTTSVGLVTTTLSCHCPEAV
jgi:hypothetical protein